MDEGASADRAWGGEQREEGRNTGEGAGDGWRQGDTERERWRFF